MAFSPDGKLLAAGDGGQGVHLFDVATGKSAGQFGASGKLDAGGVAFLGPDRLLTVTRGALKVWDVKKREEVGHMGRGPSVSYATSPAAGLTVISHGGAKGGRLLIWGPGAEKPRTFVPEDEDHFEQLTFSPDGSLLASSGGKDRSIRVYRMPQLELVRSMGKFEGGLGTKMAFSPDNKILASSGTQELRLWSVETGRELPPLEGDRGANNGCFSPDGKVLAAYHRADKGIRLWDVATRKERAFLPVRYVEHLAFSPKGAVLGAGLADKSVKLIDVSGVLP
jgi:WD40 repeat protein